MSKRVYLKPVKEKRVMNGHPWVFASDIDRAERGVRPGDIVTVVAARGRPIGMALYNSHSQITLRMLTDREMDIDAGFIKERVRQAISLRRQLGILGACRLINAESDGLPAVIVDQYADVLSVQILSLGMANFQQDIVDTLVEELKPRGIWERNDVPVRRLEGMEQSTGLLYGEVPEQVQVTENGLTILVDVKRGQKTGYFLDQRENRAAIAPFCRDAKVLDICTHTGSFALHAAHYGAKDITAVDISETAIDCAKDNAKANGFTNIDFVTANAFDYLRQQSDAGARYDLIILDPPAFAKNKAALHGAFKGYKEINLRALKMLEPGGILVTCSCSQAMQPPLFLDMLQQAATDARVGIQVLDWRGPAKDHPMLPAAPETNYLKCVFLRVVK